MMKIYYKILIILVLSLVFITNILNAQNLFTYQISDIGNNQLEITFAVQVEDYSYNNYCNDQCNWNFGDGQIQELDKQWYYTHIYDLNNVNLISNGYFIVDVTLTYKGFSTTVEDCDTEEHLVHTETISYYVGETTVDVDFYTNPDFEVYQEGETIEFFFKLNPVFVSNSDNLTYVFTNINTGQIISEFISPADIYSEIQVDYDLIPNEGTYTFQLDIEQWGSNIASAIPITITVVSSDGSANTGDCECSDLSPILNVNKVTSGGNYKFYLYDNSTTEFTDKYAGCADSDYFLKLFINGTFIEGTPLSQYNGNGALGNFEVAGTDFLGEVKDVKIEYSITCLLENGVRVTGLQTFYNETLEVPEFIEEYTISKWGNKVGEEEIINLNSTICRAYDVSSNNPTDDFSYILEPFDISHSSGDDSYKWGDLIKFRIYRNATGSERVLTFKLYFNSEDENSYSIVDGERVHYRTIIATQPTFIENFDETSDLIPFPDFYIPDNTSYFQIWSGGGDYHRIVNDQNMSLEVLEYCLDNWGYIEIQCYNEDGLLLNYDYLSVKREACTLYPFNKTEAGNYDIYIHNANTVLPVTFPLQVDNYSVEPGKTLVLTSSSGVILKPGFHAKNGSCFIAKSEGCYAPITKVDTSEVIIEEPIVDTLTIQEEDGESISEDITTAINSEKNLESINVYPNPTKGIFNIDISAIENRIENIKVYTISGSIIIEVKNDFENFHKIDLTNYPVGLYIVRVLTDEKYYYKKIIKE